MEAGALGFMARAKVQATLPHRKVDGNEFERRNGAFTLSLMAPAKIGLPYGYAECPVHPPNISNGPSYGSFVFLGSHEADRLLISEQI